MATLTTLLRQRNCFEEIHASISVAIWWAIFGVIAEWSFWGSSETIFGKSSGRSTEFSILKRLSKVFFLNEASFKLSSGFQNCLGDSLEYAEIRRKPLWLG